MAKFSSEHFRDQYRELKVMNNYFGIGLDAKIALEFHNKREESDKASILFVFELIRDSNVIVSTSDTKSVPAVHVVWDSGR